MDKILVVVFDSEVRAYEGSKALQELQYDGSINLYSKIVIVRDAGGRVEVKQKGDMGPVGASVGLLAGSLIGLLGGPVGAALGAGAGTFVGMLFDLARIGVTSDFLYDVETSLKPGKAAVVAEVWEEWSLPVDNRMEELGGVVYRSLRKEVWDSQILKDTQEIRAEIADLKAERNRVTGAAKANIEKKLKAAEGRLQSVLDDYRAKVDTGKQETDAKVQSLQEQAAKANGERKAKLEASIAEHKADQNHRNELLKQAAELTKEALSV